MYVFILHQEKKKSHKNMRLYIDQAGQHSTLAHHMHAASFKYRL